MKTCRIVDKDAPLSTHADSICRIAELERINGKLLAACKAANAYFDTDMFAETSEAFQRLRHKVTDAIGELEGEEVHG